MEVQTWSQLIEGILLRKAAFFVAFFAVFTLSYSFLAWIDFLPEMVEPKDQTVSVEETEAGIEAPIGDENQELTPGESTLSDNTVMEVSYPTSIYIEALDRQIDVLNPTSRNINDLDTALLKGVVRHPDSATLERTGTVFLLGHSSYLPVVNNKSFQAFNGIQKLKWGDLIEVTSAQGKYIYRVEKVYQAKAQNVTVPIAGSKKRLVLATCNSFGSTDDRYIVEAELIEERLF